MSSSLEIQRKNVLFKKRETGQFILYTTFLRSSAAVSGYWNEPKRDQVSGRRPDPEYVSSDAASPVPPHPHRQSHLLKEVCAGQVCVPDSPGHRHQYLDVLHHS